MFFLVLLGLQGLGYGEAGPPPAGVTAQTATAFSLPSPEDCDVSSIEKGSSIPARIRRVLYKAQQLMKREAYREVVTTLERFLQKHPGRDHCLLEFSLGNALYSSGENEASLSRFQRAVSLDPCYGPGWVNLGQVAFELGKYGPAADALCRGFDLSKEKNPDLIFYAALARIQEDRPRQAVPLLEALVRGKYGDAKKEWFQPLVYAYMVLDRQGPAEKLLKRMLSLYGEDPETWKLTYRFEAGRGNYKTAAVAMTVYGYLTDLSPQERILLADLYATINVPVVACGFYEKALESDSSPEVYERLASAYLAAHKPLEARKVLTRALEVKPTARLWSLLGDLLYMQEDFQGAYEAFKKSAGMDEANGRASLMMGYCALQTGKKKLAAVHLLKAAAYPGQKKTARRLLHRIHR